MVDAHHEVEDVPTGLAAEAEIQPARRGDME
jgi:hypothetical protein